MWHVPFGRLNTVHFLDEPRSLIIRLGVIDQSPAWDQVASYNTDHPSWSTNTLALFFCRVGVMVALLSCNPLKPRRLRARRTDCSPPQGPCSRPSTPGFYFPPPVLDISPSCSRAPPLSHLPKRVPTYKLALSSCLVTTRLFKFRVRHLNELQVLLLSIFFCFCLL